jgi:Leucine-rich repeat (LRR) protein
VKKLRKLEVSNNFISDTIPDELYTLTQLESIYLSFNWFSGTLSTWIGRLSNLSGFFVDSNDLSGTLPSEIGLVSTLSSLGKCPPMAYDSSFIELETNLRKLNLLLQC